jgi:hypothetical protein
MASPAVEHPSVAALTAEAPGRVVLAAFRPKALLGAVAVPSWEVRPVLGTQRRWRALQAAVKESRDASKQPPRPKPPYAARAMSVAT